MTTSRASPSIDLLGVLDDQPALEAVREAIEQGGRAIAGGAVGSAPALLAAWLALRVSRPLLLIAAHVDEADDMRADIEAAGHPAAPSVSLLPAIETLPGESHASFDLFAQRVAVVRELAAGAFDAGGIIVAPIHALMQPVPDPDELSGLVRRIAPGHRVDPGELLDWLDRAGYRRRDAVEEPGDTALRGGIMDVFPASGQAPIRLDFFGDEIERLTEIDPDTMASDRAIGHAELIVNDPDRAQRPGGRALADLLPPSTAVLLHETLEIAEQGRGYYERLYDGSGVVNPRDVLGGLERRAHALVELNRDAGPPAGDDTRLDLPFDDLPELSRDASEAVAELARQAERGRRVIVACRNPGERQRLGELVDEFAPGAREAIVAIGRPLTRGLAIDAPVGDNAGILIVTYHELLHRPPPRRTRGGLRGGRATDVFMEFDVGDYVVHAEHGIARFTGLELIKPKKRPAQVGQPHPQEYLTLEFAGRRRLRVPATQIDRVQKYVGGRASKPTLSTLGGVRWKHQKEKVAESVRDLASEMLRVRAARESMPGVRYPADTPWQKEFEAEFPYEETEDQIATLSAIKRDMASPRPMDRLVCGDVGFGKTELAIRAAFKACEYGRQAAVLVPTTVLAEQHERTFRDRFADYPFVVDSLSRFKSAAEMRDVLDRLGKGQVDVVIGTHRLLSPDVRFADLGLLVIDEEQRFGVEHKEALLRFRMTVDVLTLTATPIPRTLHMAMLGIRDISSLTTPPVDRRSIVTEVVPFTERRVARAIARELSRGGQVYYVHNRVHNIHAVADRVRALAPEARVVVGHGQMPGAELEQVMLGFVRREADVLVCTTIIESGIDIPTANTMIVADAHRFGLAELHQLRGRVGRSAHRAYCYLLEPEDGVMSDVAKKRLAAIEEYAMLGAGFKIAMRDLEIRGAGNLLGPEQSGHIAAVGYDMYCRLLDRAVKELKNERVAEPPSSTTIEIGAAGLIPRAYIPSDRRRLEAYRRLATAESESDLDRFASDLVSAYGKPPKGVDRLIELARVRVAAAGLGVRAITRRESDLIFAARDPGAVAEALEGAEGTVRVLEGSSGSEIAEVYYRPPPSYLEPDTLLPVLRHRLGAQAATSE